MYIETVPKRGYRFVAPVTRSAPENRMNTSATSVEMPARPASVRLLWAASVGGVLATIGLLLFVLSPPVRQSPAVLSTPASRSLLHRQVTFTGHEGAPAISPDGTHLAYVSADGPERVLVIQDMTSTQLVQALRAPELGQLRWLPDGTELLFFARVGGFDGVYTVPKAGGIPRRIVSGRFQATWSPDGSTIAVAI